MIERDILLTNPNVHFDDIAGLADAKALLNEALMLPALIPNFFRGIRRPWKGVLMFGPPGTGKTMLAKAVATECNMTFMNVSTTTLSSKWRGDSERLVRILFEMARFYAPTVIFIDEIDSLASARGGDNEHEASRRVKSELLVQMDGLSQLVGPTAANAAGDESPEQPQKSGLVMVLGATNLPWDLDEALRRRMEKRVYIEPPQEADRLQQLRLNLAGINLADDVELEKLAALTSGFSGADLTSMCRQAANAPLDRLGRLQPKEILAMMKSGTDLKALENQPVTQKDLLAAFKATKPSVNAASLEKYRLWMEEYGSAGRTVGEGEGEGEE
jgi:katanin p60 ATPase-containing subunit A1